MNEIKKYKAGDTILIPMMESNKVIPVEIIEAVGMLCVHESLYLRPERFNVTHIPSGRAICQSYARENALTALHRLAECGFDWSQLDGSGTEDAKLVDEAAREIVTPVLIGLFRERIILI